MRPVVRSRVRSCRINEISIPSSSLAPLSLASLLFSVGRATHPMNPITFQSVYNYSNRDDASTLSASSLLARHSFYESTSAPS